MTETLQEKGKRLQKERDYKVDVDKYILVHVDGRSFSKLIKNKFKKPFDKDFIEMMNKTAIFLCENVQGVKIAYVQSDEISLLLKKDSPEGDIFFGGRLCKMQSIIASLATSEFNRLFMLHELAGNNTSIEDIANMKLAQFDCKVWDVDNGNDAFAWFLFRNIDCVRNSKQQFAQAFLSHKRLLNHTTDEQISMAEELKGKKWNDCQESEKYGRIVSKENFEYFLDDGTPYFRTRWTVHDGTDLAKQDKRKDFLSKYEFFNILQN